MFEICSDLSKIGPKVYYKCQYSKKAKNGQMAKPFYFWQTVSKRPIGNPGLILLSRMTFYF